MEYLNSKVCVIIPCHNDWVNTRSCLSALIKSNYSNFEIIVVDDGSIDGTSKFIKKQFPQINVIKGDGNLWWSQSINLGIQEAFKQKADYILVLNNDVIISQDAINSLVKCAEDNTDAIIGSLIYNLNNPNIIWSAGGILKWPWPGEIQVGQGELDLGQYNGVRAVEWTPGMGTLIRRDILMKLNLFDNINMPQYIADVDFCLRARDCGYSVLIISQSKLYNNIENTGGISNNQIKISIKNAVDIFTNFRSTDYFRARLTFILRHCPWYWLIPSLFIRYIRLFFYILHRLI